MRIESIFAASDGAALDPVVILLSLIVMASILAATVLVLKIRRTKTAQANSAETAESPSDSSSLTA